MKAKLTSLFLLLAAPLLHAQATPGLMSYQGRVTDAAGVLIGNTNPANRLVTFKLYSASSGGTTLYAETQTVTISGGEFSVLIGNGTGISGSPGPSSPATTPYKTLADIVNAATYTSLYLGITVDDGTAAADLEISPRQQMVSGAFALRAKVAESVAGGAVTTAMMGDGQVSTAKIAAAAVDSSRIADASILAADIANSTITAAKLDTGTIGFWTPVGSSVYRNGYVGIGEANPGFPLNFGTGLGFGDKISLWNNAGNSYGFGMQGALLQIHTDGAGSDVAFGYGSSAAMTETMRVKGNGNVGIGYASPGAKLDVNGVGRFGNDAAKIGFVDVGFYGDGSNIALRAPSAGATYIQGASGTNTWMHIGNTGNVGIGNIGADVKLSVSGGVRAAGAGTSVYPYSGGYSFASPGDTDGGMFSGADGTLQFLANGAEKVRITPAGLAVNTTDLSQGTLSVAGGLTSIGSRSSSIGYARMQYSADQNGIAFDVYNTSQGGATNWRGFRYDGDSNIDYYSDRSLKTDIVDAEPMLDRLMQLSFRRFHWKDNAEPSAQHEFGVIAQEVQPLFPDLVSQGKDGLLMVGYGTFATIACKAVQELKVDVDDGMADIQQQLDDKDQKIADLEARLGALEKLIRSAK